MADPFNDLQILQRRFDEHLKSLEAPDAAERLRAVMRSGGKLTGATKAGLRPGFGDNEVVELMKQADVDEQALRRSRWSLQYGRPHLPINNVPSLKYDSQRGVEAFAEQFRYASWTQLLHLERHGVDPVFFVDLIERTRLGIEAIAAQRLLEASKNIGQRDDGAPRNDSGRLAISLLRIVNRALDVFPDPEENASKGFDPWVWVGAWIDQPLRSIGDARLVDYMDLLVGSELADAAFSEVFDRY